MSTFRFAIMGAGNIAHQFCDAVTLVEDCEVSAIASKDLGRAQKFAEECSVAHAYDNYEQMLIEEKPDCVYIAVTPNDHFRVTDGLASWNQGDFLVSWHEGETTCERVEDNQSINVVELDINTLTALMMGYKRPTYLYDHEKISMEYYMLTWLERLIPVKKPYFSDYF